MPTPTQSADKLSVRGRKGGKHWTQAEVDARESAAESMTRKRRAQLKAPDWLSEDALKVWKDLRKKLAGIELLDNLDTEMLGIYCDAIVNYHNASKILHQLDGDGISLATDERIKTAQAWARIVSTYADKLGLSPSGRARLAKKKAEKKTDQFAEDFGG
jgi:P27 family predicted phage terminase small subunit